MNTALIISDGKPGHFNQSVALCKHLGINYEIVDVSYKSKNHKALSYLFDRVGLYTETLFSNDLKPQTPHFKLIISAGSTTCYANKLLARKLNLPNVAILHPEGYRLDFTHIFCPAYDHPPKRQNITELPINLCTADESFFAEQAAQFQSLHTPKASAVGIIIGGSSAVSEIDPVQLQKQLEQMFRLTDDRERWVTTSRRTPKEIEQIVESFPFDYQLINSRDPYNPIPAFIQLCDRLFVTSDSASMISECASFGTAKVEILMNRQLKTPNKFEELINGLETQGAAHIFDGTLGHADTKINLGSILRDALSGML